MKGGVLGMIVSQLCPVSAAPQTPSVLYNVFSKIIPLHGFSIDLTAIGRNHAIIVRETEEIKKLLTM